MKTTLVSFLLSLAAAAPLIAQNSPTPTVSDPVTLSGVTETHSGKEGDKHAAMDRMSPNLAAVLSPTKGNKARGVVTFEPLADNQVRVTVHLTGLKPNSKHAMHVHEFGDISSADGSSAGGHFNPAGKEHGLPGDDEHHPGDFGNLETDAEGNANEVLTIHHLSLIEGDHAIVGRALIVHAGEDKGTQPSGDAGDRIAQGVIAIANPAATKSTVAWRDKEIFMTPETRIVTTPTGEERLERAAEKIGEGAQKAARTTLNAVERGAEEVGEALKKVGKKIEEAAE